MKKKIPVYILIGLCLILSLFFSISAYLRYSSRYIKTYVASHNISQRNKLTDSDIKEILVPREYLNEDVYIDKKDILDKYVKLSYSIPKGSLFYVSCLQSNIKDMPHKLLNEGQINYDLYTNNIKINTANLGVNMYVDIYLTISNKDKPISDILIENCRITGLYDYEGKIINDYDLDSRVGIISLAIGKDDINILNKALKIGEISVYVSSNPYTTDISSNVVKESEVFEYLQ